MIRACMIGGKKYRIHQSDVLGAGGEATVVKVGNWAVKLYHQPTSARSAKLRDFISLSLPSNVYAPQHLVYDSTGKKIVGHAMNLTPRGYQVVQNLSRKSFRKAHPQFNSEYIANLFIDIFTTTDQLHRHNPAIIVGDYNDLNLEFNAITVAPPVISVFIDVDSFQFARHACMVATETYLDPNLYNVDLSQKPIFAEENDWYSFWCMVIKCLIMAHPYGGFHPDYSSLPQRAVARVTVFDKGVKYPKPALNPEILNDDFMEIIDKVFKQGHRIKPDIAMLENYRDSLVKCATCQTMHPSERSSCPQCAKINTQQMQRKVNIVKAPGKRTIESEELLTTSGDFIWHKLAGRHVYAIAIENNKYVLYHKVPNTPAERTELFAVKSKLAKFDMFAKKYLVVNQEPTDHDLLILDINGPVGLEKRTASRYEGERVFSCSKDSLLRVQQTQMFRGFIHGQMHSYTENFLIDTMENQAWIQASPIDECLFGFQRYFNELKFFVLRFGGKATEQFNVNIPSFDNQESILDMTVEFAVNALLFLVKTEKSGKTYTRVYVISLSNGEIVSNYKVEALASDTHRSIHGKAFAKPSGTAGIILHPTDDGIVQESIGTNKIQKQTLISETEPFVAETDTIEHYGNGILVVGDRQINCLTMT